MKKALSLVFYVLFLTSCGKNQENQTQKTDNYPVVSPIRVSPQVNIDYVSSISAIQHVEIRSRVKGYLDRIFVDEGKPVRKGQLMFSIHNPELKENVAKAKAIYKSTATELKDAELQLINVKRLVEKDVVSTTELELARNKVEMIKARLDQARAEEASASIQAAYTQITAPFSGIVSRIPNKIGSLVEDGTLLTMLSNNEQIYAYFDVSEKEYLNYMKTLNDPSMHSNEVTLVLANEDTHQAPGLIETTEGQIDPNTGNIAFRARFNNPGLLVKHGASGKVRLRKSFENVLVIPQKATFEIQDRTYVFVLNAKNEVKTQAVNINYRIPHFFIIDGGLSENDRIIYEGVQSLKEGMKVKPITTDLKGLYQKLTQNPA